MTEGEWQEVMNNAEPMCLNTDYYVAMANKLISGKSSLDVKSAKLIRTTIMQIKKDDTEIYPYEISIKQFAELIDLKSTSDLYRDVKKTCEELLKQIVVIGDKNDPKKAWKAFQWVSYCEYRDGYVYIKLNEELKPYLVGLKQYYTQYHLQNILVMKSAYSIRIYELIMMELKNTSPRPGNPLEITIMMDVLRRATDTEKKLLKSNDFKKRVIDPAQKEINNLFWLFKISEVRPVKRSRSIVGYTFKIESRDKELSPEKQEYIQKVLHNARERDNPKDIDNQIHMTFED